MTLSINEIVEAIDVRPDRINGEIAALQGARNALDGKATSSQRLLANRKGRARTKSREGPEGMPAGKLERLLRENSGTTTTTLAELANAESDDVLALLKELEAAGKAERTGQRRGTRWHAITTQHRTQPR